MKKIFSLVFAILIILSSISIYAEAVSGSLGTNFSYTFEDGIFTISGKGIVYNFDLASVSIDLNTVTKLIFQEGVTGAGSQFFKNKTNLLEVQFPSTFKTVGSESFSGCTSLNKITWGGVEVIGYQSFASTALTQVTIPDTVTSIEESAFMNCSSLSTVTLPDKVIEIDARAFDGTQLINNWENSTSKTPLYIGKHLIRYTPSNSDATEITVNDIKDDTITIASYAISYNDSWKYYITSATIPDSVQFLGRNFDDCGRLKTLDLGTGLVKLGEYAFYNCSGLTEVTLPDSLTGLPRETFNRCSSLKSIVWGKNISYLGRAALQSTAFEEVTIPSSVTSIESAVFWSCEKLKKVTIDKNVTSIDSDVFAYCNNLTELHLNFSDCEISNSVFRYLNNLTTLILGNDVSALDILSYFTTTQKGKLTTLSLGNSLKSIKKSQLTGFTALTTISLGDNITSIENGTFDNTAYYLNSSNWTDGVLYIDKYLIKAKTAEIPTSYTVKNDTIAIANSAFYNCTGLQEISLPSTLKTVCSSAFYGCSKLKSISFLSNINQIGYSAFNGCTSLKSVSCSGNISLIESQAFYGCTGMTDFSVTGYIKEIGENGFYSCTSLTNIPLNEGLESVGRYAFNSCRNLEFTTLPDSVKNIGLSAFNNTKNYSNKYDDNGFLYLGNSLIAIKSGTTDLTLYPNTLCIAAGAYNYVTSNLTELTLPESLRYISNDTFTSATNLTNVTFGSNLKSIGSNAFAMSGIKKLVLPDTIESVGTQAFKQCNNLVYVEINCKSVGTEAFTNCTNIKTLLLNNGLENIDEKAFNRCSSLESVIIPDSVKNIGSEAFAYCTSLKNVTVGNQINDPTAIFNTSCKKLEKIVITDATTDFDPYGFGKPENGPVDIYYTGSKQDWNSKVKIANNEDLSSCADRLIIHFGYNPPPEATITSISGNGVDAPISIDIKVSEEDKTLGGKFIGILFNNDAPSAAAETNLSGDSTISFKENQTGSSVKIFWWNDLSTLKPVSLPTDAYIAQ